MANGVFHTAYGIEIDLTLPDLGHPDRPGLLAEITAPIDRRERELLECLEHHRVGCCRAEDDDRAPWMTIRRRTAGGRTGWVAAHLPVRHTPTAEESAKHSAMKERIARVAERHGLHAEVEARAADGRVRTDVLVTGDSGLRIGWEAQYAPIGARAVRRRSRRAAEHGVVPLWVTDSDRSAAVERAPWARVDDFGWREIASSLAMVVRAGVRHLQQWKCLPSSERPCPVTDPPLRRSRRPRVRGVPGTRGGTVTGRGACHRVVTRHRTAARAGPCFQRDVPSHQGRSAGSAGGQEAELVALRVGQDPPGDP